MSDTPSSPISNCQGDLSPTPTSFNHGKRRCSENTPDIRDRKRRKLPAKLANEYTIGWICALPIERAAACAMLDEEHDDLPKQTNDSNAYTLGSIGRHNVVIAGLPNYGTSSAAHVMSNMIRSFQSIYACLLVGIGGGVPGSVDLRLGDVVVGTRVVQHDFGKVVAHGALEMRAVPVQLRSEFATAISTLQGNHERERSRISSILQEMVNKHPEMARYTYSHPRSPDSLFLATYHHGGGTGGCHGCDLSMTVDRPLRSDCHPRIHYGGIASGNQVVKDGIKRDNIGQQLDVICLEMEASGLSDAKPTLVIRGICDYADSHKNEQWQEYAAATAAAYAKELLAVMPVAAPTHSSEPWNVGGGSDQCKSEERREQLLKALSFHSIDSRQSYIRTNYAKTCKWLLKHPTYRDWRDAEQLAQHRGFMWISGKPGAGKSTLMKYAFTNLRRGLGTSDAVAAFFFNARGDQLGKSTTGMYRSLLFHLLVQFPDLQQIFDDLDINSDHYTCPSLEDLRVLLQNAISRLRKRSFTFFVDALDECDEQEVRDMVQHFEVLGEQAVAEDVRLWICFSSRHYPHISIQRSLRWDLEDQEGHKADLNEYVRKCLKADQYPLAAEIRETILQKAAGVFMWVILVIDILNKEIDRGRIFAIKDRLQECPGRLSDLFREILKRDQDNMDDLRLCIQWVLYASSPLTPDEFYFAILSGISRNSLTKCTSSELTEENLDRFVVSTSKGLAEITKSKHQTVQFIHESVRDFLLKDKGFKDLWPEHGDDFESHSHEKLKQCCVEYMGLDTSQCIATDAPIPEEKDAAECLRTKTLQEFPFLRYSVQNVLYHADSAAVGVAQNDFLEHFAFSRWIQLDNLFQRYKVRRFTNRVTQLYVFADKGLANLFRVKHDRNSDVWTEVSTERFRIPLLAAVANGHKQVVRTLLKDMSPPCEESDIDALACGKRGVPKGCTALTWVIQEGHEKLAEILIKKGANVNAVDYQNRPVLWWAALRHLVSTTKLLVEGGADISRIHGGFWLHHIATDNKNEAMARFLITTGIFEVDSRGSSGETPLHNACEYGQKTIVQLLVDNSAQLDLCDSSGSTPLHIACENGYDAIVQLLVDNGAQISLPNGLRHTPLHIACVIGNETIARLLVDNGAQISPPNGLRHTPLHIACVIGNETIARLLVDKDAQISPQDSSSNTPLHIACENGYDAIVQLLVDNGAQISPPNGLRHTPLHIACVNGNETVARLLVDKGAQISLQDLAGDTPLHKACERSNLTIVQMLIDSGAEISCQNRSADSLLIEACRQGHKAVAQLLIDKGADTNARDSRDRTPLHKASSTGHEAIAQLLIDKGAELNNRDNLDHTPLHDASLYGREAIVQLLIDNGAEINARDDRDWTPLHSASLNGHKTVAQLLVHKGAETNARDNHHATPLHIASLHGWEAIVQLLSDNSAEINAQDDRDWTPLHIASRYGKEAIVQLLLNKGADVTALDFEGNTPQQWIP